ncbi:glutamate 5-kinase [Candidatus Sumerlaeota bacterium]|nr:glutamate 5-kinase [Candidatus Sumerlaeota bacterium]
MTFDRAAALADVQRVVIKLGTAVLTRGDRRLDRALIFSLAEQVASLRHRGIDVIIVSSGAVGAGVAEMGFTEPPGSVTDKQAMAAVGQGLLMQIYQLAFSGEGIHTAQVLLSRGDLDDRQRYLNARNAVLRLLELGVVPIVNENDTTAIDELTFGDNDLLSAAVAAKVDAQLLVILTIVDGLHDAEGGIISVVERVTDETMALVRSERSALGKGGMESKLLAAKSAATSGVAAVIAAGKRRNVIDRIFAGEPLGTWFVPSEQGLRGRKRWIAMGKAHRDHRLVIDVGAVRALTEKAKSLLPIGITSVEGDFNRGDLVEIVGPDGAVIGRGLVNYSGEQIARILGARSGEIVERLGEAPFEEVIHRDNLIIYR